MIKKIHLYMPIHRTRVDAMSSPVFFYLVSGGR